MPSNKSVLFLCSLALILSVSCNPDAYIAALTPDADVPDPVRDGSVADLSCRHWLVCVEECGADPACQQDCDDHAWVVDQYVRGGLQSCMEQNCPSDCESVGSDVCVACRAEHCTDEEDLCLTSEGCLPCDDAFRCLTSCNDDLACQEYCREHLCPEAGAQLEHSLQCEKALCDAECSDTRTATCQECITTQCDEILVECGFNGRECMNCEQTITCLEACSDAECIDHCKSVICPNLSSKINDIDACRLKSCSKECVFLGTDECRLCLMQSCEYEIQHCMDY